MKTTSLISAIETAGNEAVISSIQMPMLGESSESFSLYFHVPFCTKKCDYCHFYVIPDKNPFKISYMEGLRLEWERVAAHFSNKKLESIYFGGGTPSLLGSERVGEILSWVSSLGGYKAGIEITLEANPEDVSFERMRDYAAVGINRVSMGVQSLDDRLLSVLSRQHLAKRAIQAVEDVHRSGISNISIDLMYDIPHQTFDAWEASLHQAVRLPITHLSLYNLVFEPHTVYYKRREELQTLQPREEISTQMYRHAVDTLSASGLFQYEISAFAKAGLHSRHNVGYWIGRPFWGLGPSAFSYWEGKRFSNCANLNRYVRSLQAGESPIDYEESLPEIARRRELLAVALRLVDGVDRNLFERIHGRIDAETLHALSALQSQGLVLVSDSSLRLTSEGVLFYDTVASEII